jgi:2-polyprenyl-3-methyl-5-hydroxy-6-metoxy-1,4-benzoquinol methylase
MMFREWDEAYEGVPPWDIGRPQPAFEALVGDGEIRPGRVLDAGCGTGENALMLARAGCAVTGIDLARDAIGIARKKAAERHIHADFVAGNVLDLDQHFGEGTFDTVIDSGLFHALSDEERPVYARQLSWVLRPGGQFFMLCFSDREPGEWGPRRISRREIEDTFCRLFRINYIKESCFISRTRNGRPHAYLLSATKE